MQFEEPQETDTVPLGPFEIVAEVHITPSEHMNNAPGNQWSKIINASRSIKNLTCSTNTADLDIYMYLSI